MNMTALIKDILMYTYISGSVIAFIIGYVDCVKRMKRGENTDDFPAMICVITLLSWVYIILNLIKRKE